METTKVRRLQPPAATMSRRSPYLRRSSSSSSAISLPEIHPSKSNSAQTSTVRSSRSATSSPRPSNNAKIATKMTTKENTNDAKDTDGKFLKVNSSRSSTSPHNMGVKRVPSGSPSAWALSPGRPRSPCPLPESPKMINPSKSKVSGVGGVLKYFCNQKQKKELSLVQEEELHQYKIFYNRLLQWRFANARAEIAMDNRKLKAEENIFYVWLKMYKMRYKIAEKLMIVQRLRQKIRLLETVWPQLEMLIEWERLEKRNSEAIGRINTKLSAISTQLPLVQGAKLDIVSLYDAMSLAADVMDDMESLTDFVFQAKENSLRAYLIQANKEASSGQEHNNYNHRR
ncbi:QWRF motif-containing protein, partial [Drosera capensis]